MFNAAEVLFYLQGIILPATRLLDPCFRNIFVKQITRFYRKITCRSHINGYEYLASSSQNEEAIEPIDLFLNSVLNVELVYIILRAITDIARVSDFSLSAF